MKKLLTILSCFTLVACIATLSPDRYIPEERPNLEEEGVVVLKLFGEGKSHKPKNNIQVNFREVDSLRHYDKQTSGQSFSTFKLPVGKWYIVSAFPSMVMINRGYKSPDYNPEYALPIEPFEVKAGETIYLGTIKIDGVQYQQMIYPSNTSVSYSITNEFEDAKTYFDKIIAKNPEELKGFSAIKENILTLRK